MLPPPPHDADHIVALRRRLAALRWERRLTDELVCELRHYARHLIDRGDELSTEIAKLRIKVRIAEWRCDCGRLPEHLEQLRRAA
jgi:hypothetical protein